jgi:beta-mannosidase
MKKLLLKDRWRLSHFDPTTEPPLEDPPHGWKTVTVPGCCQTSPFGLPRTKLYQGTKILDLEWMEKRLWIYRRAVQVPKANSDETVRIVFSGLDYLYQVIIDGKSMASGEGMFHEVVIPLDFARGKRVDLEVRFKPPAQTRLEHLETTKAQFGRGWDFAPTLRTIGIWDDVHIEVVPCLRVQSVFIDTRLHNTQRALVKVHVELSEIVEDGWLNLSLCKTERRIPVLRAQRLTAFIEIESPELWWPKGLGKPALHDLSLTLEVAHRRTEKFIQKVGLREVGRSPAPGQHPVDIPLQFTVNQVPFFINGVNWVPPDSCIGEITPAQYDRQLKMYQTGHVNLVRVWGGGLREKSHFYQKCDELGLLVIQEYPVACGLGRSNRFHRQLQAEARQIARTLRCHPSVFLFSGGNENYHYWNMLDSEEPALKKAAELAQIAVNGGKPFAGREWLGGAIKRYDEPAHLILGGVTAEEAPNCLYQNTSPMEGEGEVHGIWNWNPRIGDHRYRAFDTIYEYWRAADQHFYSEASVSSIANLETIRDVTGNSSNMIPRSDDKIWNLHHAFHAAWDLHRDLWLDIPATEKIFGPIRGLRELILLNQYLQAEGGRFMIEELRRKQPVVTGVVWWGINEPWPGLAGNALIDYYGRPKLSWPIISNAYSPVILSLRYDGIRPSSLKGELWLSCNDRQGFAGNYIVRVIDHKGHLIDLYEGACEADYLKSRPLRQLTPVRLGARDHVSVQTTLLDKYNRSIHENLYLFGNIRKQVTKLWTDVENTRKARTARK